MASELEAAKAGIEAALAATLVAQSGLDFHHNLTYMRYWDVGPTRLE